MQVEFLSYLNEEGVLVGSRCPQIDPASLIKGYRIMALTRHVDERMITLQRQGGISFALSSLGEEACSVASAAALQPCDWLYPQYRENGAYFWRGGSVKSYMHQMFCTEKDVFKGRQMPNHFGSRELNIVQVSSPIATKIPHAAGCGYAMRFQKESSIALCYFGEGATSEGDFHVGLNFAAVRKSQTIFFCRNNGYAISTPTRDQFASDGVAPKGIGYGIYTLKVDGNDYFAVYESLKRARDYSVSGKGPVFIEAVTYRLGAHSTSDDPTLYRSDEEVESWRKKDPLIRLRRYLEKQGLWNEEKEKTMMSEITSEVDEAIAEAKSCPKPALHSMVEGVYFQIPEPLERHYQECQQEDSSCPS